MNQCAKNISSNSQYQKYQSFVMGDGGKFTLHSPCGLVSTRWRQVGLVTGLVSLFFLVYVFLSRPPSVHHITSPPKIDLPARRQTLTFRKNCTLHGESIDLEVLAKLDSLKNELGIPRILHRTWKNKDIPVKWQPSVESCLEANPDYAFCLWADDELESYMTVHYSWFLETYLGYPYHIQRVDAVRYFILYRYGGVYLDLDLSCLWSFDAMLSNYTGGYLDVAMAETDPTGVTNSFIAAQRGSRFIHQLTLSLADNNVWYVIPYATIMYSTGPMFVTRTYWRYESDHQRYESDHQQELQPHQQQQQKVLLNKQHPQQKLNKQQELDASLQIYVVPIAYYKRIYFKHLVGNSWHRWDAKTVKFLGRWLWMIKILGVCAAVLAAVALGVQVVRKWRQARVRALDKTAPV